MLQCKSKKWLAIDVNVFLLFISLTILLLRFCCTKIFFKLIYKIRLEKLLQM